MDNMLKNFMGPNTNAYDEEELFDTGSMDLLGLFIQDEMNRKEGTCILDTVGADKLFIEGFLSPKLSEDFFFIAQDFLSHHFSRLQEFDELAYYGNGKSYQTDPQMALQIKLLSLIYKAAKAEDPYSVELIKQLYKTYHKKEYQQLKRFNKISATEILSLAKDEYGQCSIMAIARILGMCVIYKITIDERASVFYLFLDRKSKELDDEVEEAFYKFPDGLFSKCLEQVNSWLDEDAKNNTHFLDEIKIFRETDDFVSLCLNYEGYPEDFIYRCNDCSAKDRFFLAQTLTLLKNSSLKRDFTFEDVQLYAHIYRLTSTLVNLCDLYEENLSMLFGIENDSFLADKEACLLSPERITYKEQTPKKPTPKPITIAPVSPSDTTVDDYLSEIVSLQKQVRKKEEDYKHLRAEFSRANATLNELKESIKKYEQDREELIALRNYTYGLSEEMPEIKPESIAQMQEELAEHNILIIGGHINWINKLKQIFTNWSFIHPDAVRIVDDKLLGKTEHVYFYTGYINHKTYYKFISTIREKGIPFGYLHTVNVESITRQVYRDIT